MEHDLQDFIWDMFVSTGIPVHRCNSSVQDCAWIDQGLRQGILGMTDLSEIVHRRLAAHGAGSTVYYDTDVFQCSYVGLKLPDGDFILIGPVLFERMTPQRFKELFQGLGLPERFRAPLQEYYRNLKYSPVQGSFEKIVDLWADHIYGKDGYQVIRKKEYPLNGSGQFRFDPLQELDVSRLGIQIIEERYKLENSLSRAVAAGNKALALDYVDQLQEKVLFLQLNKLCDIKNYIIGMNLVLRKAVEQAGVHPACLESYYDQSVQRIGQLSDAALCYSLFREIAQEYCGFVQNHNIKGYTLPIQKAVIHINANLSDDLSLNVLAERINVNASYLSSLFKREVGIPLTEYVNQRRIIHAKLLLLTTALPTKSIGLQCGISDIYYFSRLFKRYTGMTPRTYRKYRSEEVLPELVELEHREIETSEQQRGPRP